jgi:cell division protease FtsH
MPLDDRYLMSADELRDKIAALFGGRAAEEVIVGAISTGAANDLRQATEIARLMVCEYGMSTRLGPLSLLDPARNAFLTQPGASAPERALSELTARLVDSEISRLVCEGLDRARAIVRHNRAYLEKLAARLLVIEVLDGDEVRALLRGAVMPSLLPAPVPLRSLAMSEAPDLP